MNNRFRKYINKKFERPISLTRSQIALIKTLAGGDTLKNAAVQLESSYESVKKRTQLLYKKFAVKNRTELIKKALQLKLIANKDVKPKFRRRFVKVPVSSAKPVLRESLTSKENQYLQLTAYGFTKEEIMKKMRLPNIYFCNYLTLCICGKLNAKNINQAVVFAFQLHLI